MINKTTVGQKFFKVAVCSTNVIYQEYVALKDKEYNEEDFCLVPLNDKEEKIYWVDKSELFETKKEATKFALAQLKAMRKDLLKKTKILDKTIERCSSKKQ